MENTWTTHYANLSLLSMIAIVIDDSRAAKLGVGKLKIRGIGVSGEAEAKHSA